MKNHKMAEVRKYILKMALPAIAGLSTQMVVSLVDTAMVGRLGDAKYALAAMGLGVMATWALISFFSSLSTGTHVLVARRFGAGDFEGCGRILNSSLVLTFLIGLVVGTLGVFSAYSMAHFIAADPKVGDYAGQFLFYRFMGIPFFLMSVSYRGFFFGIGKTKIFMYSGIMVNVLNIIFNYILIFGNFGMPQMGVAGSGLGSTLATICETLFYFIFSLYPGFRTKFGYFQNFGMDRKAARSIFKLSIPVSLQNVFLLIGFLCFVAITGLIGTVTQAASQIVISSIFISLMPCFGFGIAAQTFVGNNLGSGKPNTARLFATETAKIATVYTSLIGIIFIFMPRLILKLLTDDTAIVEAAVPALRIAGVAQLFYASGVVLANGLQAGGKTLFVMFSEVISNWMVFIPASYLFGVYFKLGITGAWASLPIYTTLYSLIIFLKFKSSGWSSGKSI